MEFIIENAARIPFKNMSKEDQHTILDAKMEASTSVEMHCGDYWGKTSGASLVFEYIYRVRAINTPLVIPWDVISPEWNWAAMDQNGKPFLYGGEPIENGGTYVAGIARSIDFLNINTTGIDWRRSKTRRPSDTDVVHRSDAPCYCKSQPAQPDPRDEALRLAREFAELAAEEYPLSTRTLIVAIDDALKGK